MTTTEYYERLLVDILDEEDRGETEPVDLKLVTENVGLPFDEARLADFLNENRDLGSGNYLTDIPYFKFNKVGRDRALSLRQQQSSKTLRGWLMGFQRSDWIAISAVLVSLFALFKD